MKYSKAKYSGFIRIISKMPAKLAVFLTPYTAKDYAKKGATCYLSHDKRSGYALTKEFDLISVFSLPGAHQGDFAITDAVAKGAITLDCISDFLADIYSEFGFEEIRRMEWDDQYAPKNWDYERFGRPDIIFMRRK